MSLYRRVGRRLVFAAVSAYLALTLAFLLVALTPDPNVGLITFGVTDPEKAKEIVQAYRAARNMNDPLLQRWLRWIVGYSTFHWGRSFESGRPVVAIVSEHLPVTLAYVVPSVILSAIGSLALGASSAEPSHPLVERAKTLAAATSLGVPNYLAAILIAYAVLRRYGYTFGIYSTPYAFLLDALQTYGVSIVLLTSTFLAGQYQYARSEIREYANTSMAKLVKAKGAGPRRFARHLLRAAAIPLLSVFVTDLLGVLVVHVFVLEKVLNLPGIGAMTLEAIHQRDMPLVLGATVTFVGFGILTSFVQDVAFLLLDPRVGTEA